MKFEFTIPGKPVGKQRPKFGNGRTYTPAQTTTYENYVKLRFKQAYPDAEPIAAKVATAAVITAYFPIPQSASKKRKAEMEAGEILPTVKADLDNIAKIILDSLNGLAFYDDAQVIELHVHKRYAEIPTVDVQIMLYADYRYRYKP